MCFCQVTVNVSMCIFLNQHILTNGFVSLVRKMTISPYNYFWNLPGNIYLRGNLVHWASCMVQINFKIIRDM